MTPYTTLGVRVLGAAAAAALTLGTASTATAGASQHASASVASDTLTVVGTPGADHISLRLAAGDPTSLQVDLNDDGSADQTFDRTTFSNISVLLGNGDDSFRVDQVHGSFGDEALRVDGGNGDDTITGGDGNDLLAGGNGRDDLNGKKGADTALLGSGRDTFTWDPGDGSDTIEGDEGTDTLVFDGASASETMSLVADGPRAIFTRDLGNIRMDMGGVEVLDLHAIGGADKITVSDTTGTGFERANIDLSEPATADGPDDLVTVNGTPSAERIKVTADDGRVSVDGFSAETRITGSEARDQLKVNGRGGSDTAEIGAGVSSLIGVDVAL